MEHVNEVLILSLKQDICSLNETIENIGGGAEIHSWLFPTKNYSFVTDFIKANRIFQDNNVKLFLELAIDRLYVGLRLILNRLEEYVNDRVLKKNPFLRRPQQITLGCCFKSLWSVFSTLLTKMAEKDHTTTITSVTETNLKKKIDVDCQTDIISLNKCDSCASAMMCMKNLLTIFDGVSTDNMLFKRKIRPKLFDITQFGCMLQTTTAIENSLRSIFQKLLDKEQENTELLSSYNKMKKANDEKIAKITMLEQEVKIYKEKREKDLLKMTLLRNREEKLLTEKSKNDQKIREFEYIMTNLNDSLRVHETKIQNMISERETMDSAFRSMWNFEKKLETQCNLLQRKMSVLERGQCYVENGFKQFQATVDILNEKLNNISKWHSETETKIQNMASDISNITKESYSMVEKIDQQKENLKQKLIRSCINEVEDSTIPTPKFQIKGNPLEDISRQIEENNEKIRQLENENTKLQKIVSKFKGMKK
ncbi:uncharacterized protein [Leptinotarsa decemlineata]|uniref:uncharacterized protein n=1 Tax=Leptinotarsa decemlineata TaxID=7539 RepID=UPI003D3059B6